MADQTVSEMMQAYADDAVRAARERRVTLDFSEPSLQRLEQVLDVVQAELAGEKPSSERLQEACKLWGGYLGEVVRRRWGGEWTIETYPRGEFATPTLTINGAKMFPTLKIHRRLTEGAGENIAIFYEMMSQRLAATPGSKVQ